MSGISRIPNIDLQEAFPFYKVGWITGWYNPFSRLGDLVNPAEIGKLVVIQGEYMQNQGRIVSDLGNKLSDFAGGTHLQGPTAKG